MMASLGFISSRRQLLLWVVSGVLTVSCQWTMPGMKLLHMTVEHRGEVVLETVFDVVDTSPFSEWWEAAGEPPFDAVKTSLSPLEADPMRAQLQGDVRIRIRWVGDESMVTSAELRGLSLKRRSLEGEGWHLPAAEVSRAKEATGL